MNFIPRLFFYKKMKFMCKNELFKDHGRKMKLMYSLGTKTIFWPNIYHGSSLSFKIVYPKTVEPYDVFYS
jgi:hypothetical protein